MRTFSFNNKISLYSYAVIYYLDNEELIALNLVPLDALSNPGKWCNPQWASTMLSVEEKLNGDVLLDIDYMA